MSRTCGVGLRLQAKGGEGSAARTQLQAGSATLGDGRALPLSRIAVQTALELSDELNVDEMVAVELIVVTNHEVRTTLAAATYPTAWGVVQRTGCVEQLAVAEELLGWRAAERRHPTNGERMGSPTLQTLQAPILLTPWVCFRVAAFQTLNVQPKN
jgi:hypothetical protein